MAVEVERLIVTLEADLSKYNSNLAKGQAETASKLAAMEQSFQKMAATAKVSTGAAGSSVMSMTAAMSVAGKAALNSSVTNERLIKGMSSVGGTAQFTAAAIQKMPPALRATAAAMNTSSVAAIAATGNFSKLMSAGNGMGTMFAGIGASIGAAAVVEYASAWTKVTRSLEGSEQAFQMQLKSASELNALASDARVDLDAYSKLYVRTSAAIRDYGFVAGTAEVVTSTLAKALKLGSANAGEQTSVLLQFSQALQKGKLDGDEFRTVMENAGIVQELLAQRLGVTKGRIIEMAAAGKLQITDLVGAMVDGSAKIDRIFKQMPVTVDEAFAVLKNNVTEFIGKADQATGASQALVSGITAVGQNLDKIAVAAGALLGSATLRMVAFAAASTAAANPLTLVAAAVGALATSYGIYGDDVKLSSDGTVSLKNAVNGLIDVLSGADEVERFNLSLERMTAAQKASAIAAREQAAAQSSLTTVISETVKPMEDATIQMAKLLAKADESAGGPFATMIESTKTLAGWIADLTGLSGLAEIGLDKLGQAAERARILADRQALENRPNLGGGLADYRAGKVPEKRGTVGAASGDGKRSQFQREIDQIKKRTEALKAEVETIGQSEFAQQMATAASDLRFAAAQTAAKEGRRITAAELAAIETLSGKYAQVQVQVAFLNKLQAEKQGIEEARQELELLGLYGAELDAARTKLQLLNEAKRLGVELTPERKAEIEETAKGKAAVDQYRQAVEDLKATSSDALKGFIGDLREGKSASEALGNALDKLATKFLDAGIDGLVTSLVGGATTPRTGFASLFGFADGGIAANGRPVPLKRFANGGISNTAAIFGEAGPEAAIPLKGGKVPVELRMPAIPKAVPASSQTVNLTVAPVFQVQNGTPEGVEKMKSEIVPLIRAVVQREVPDMFDRNPRFAKLKT